MTIVFAFFKRFLIWSLVSAPAGLFLGILINFIKSDTSDFFRSTEIFYGAVLGIALSVFGSFFSITTLVLGKPWLDRSNGSEKLTGVIVCYGTIIIGLLLINLKPG